MMTRREASREDLAWDRLGSLAHNATGENGSFSTGAEKSTA